MNEHRRPGILLANLGSPDGPNPAALRRYLRRFLLDRRVVEPPRTGWWLLLNLVILPLRSRRSAALYRTIWTEDGSPLLVISRRQAARLERILDRELQCPASVAVGMRYGTPSVAQGLQILREQRSSPIVILPLFPQYSGATVGSIFDAVTSELSTWRHVPELRFISGYHDAPGYIAALAASVREAWQHQGRSARLLISFHGIPERYARAGDPYPVQCATTARLLCHELGLAEGEWALSYQSRFGREPWLGPATDELLARWGREGVTSVDVICPGFAADCLETLHEIAQENRRLFQASGGGELRYVPALNDRPDHIRALAGLVAGIL